MGPGEWQNSKCCCMVADRWSHDGAAGVHAVWLDVCSVPEIGLGPCGRECDRELPGLVLRCTISMAPGLSSSIRSGVVRRHATSTRWSVGPNVRKTASKFYSGTATYRKTFDLPKSVRKKDDHLWLDLGNVREWPRSSERKELGVLWAFPFRVDVTDALESGDNRLEVDVVNFWPNRIIGDQFLPPEGRFTRTNIRKLTRETPLAESGLLGPVTLWATRK